MVFKFIVIMTTNFWHSRISLSSFEYFKLTNCHAKFWFTSKHRFALNLLFALIKMERLVFHSFPLNRIGEHVYLLYEN